MAATTNATPYKQVHPHCTYRLPVRKYTRLCGQAAHPQCSTFEDLSGLGLLYVASYCTCHTMVWQLCYQVFSRSSPCLLPDAARARAMGLSSVVGPTIVWWRSVTPRLEWHKHRSHVHGCWLACELVVVDSLALVVAMAGPWLLASCELLLRPKVADGRRLVVRWLLASFAYVLPQH